MNQVQQGQGCGEKVQTAPENGLGGAIEAKAKGRPSSFIRQVQKGTKHLAIRSGAAGFLPTQKIGFRGALTPGNPNGLAGLVVLTDQRQKLNGRSISGCQQLARILLEVVLAKGKELGRRNFIRGRGRWGSRWQLRRCIGRGGAIEQASRMVRRRQDTSGRKVAVASPSGILRMTRMNCMTSSGSDGSVRAKANEPNV